MLAMTEPSSRSSPGINTIDLALGPRQDRLEHVGDVDADHVEALGDHLRQGRLSRLREAADEDLGNEVEVVWRGLIREPLFRLHVFVVAVQHDHVHVARLETVVQRVHMIV